MDQTIGKKIFNLRKSKNISQEKLSEAISVSRQIISKWELDETTPSTENLISLANFFNVPITYFLTSKNMTLNNLPNKKSISRNLRLIIIPFLILLAISLLIAFILLLIFVKDSNSTSSTINLTPLSIISILFITCIFLLIFSIYKCYLKK